MLAAAFFFSLVRVEGRLRVAPADGTKSTRALLVAGIEFLARALSTTQSVRGSVLEVALPSVTDGARARRDLDLYLAAWRGLHPRVEATIIDP